VKNTIFKKIYISLLFFTILCFCATLLPQSLHQDQSLIDRCYGIAHTGWSRPNTHSFAFTLLSQRNTRKLWTGWSVQSQTIMLLPNIHAHGNAYKYELWNTTILSHVMYQPRSWFEPTNCRSPAWTTQLHELGYCQGNES
jgi:hypothetical protein